MNVRPNVLAKKNILNFIALVQFVLLGRNGNSFPIFCPKRGNKKAMLNALE